MLNFGLKIHFSHMNYMWIVMNTKKTLKSIYNYPLLSCLSYFNKTHTPTILTNIDIDKYIYKKFHEDNNFYFIFPNINTHITFNPSFFHGSAILNDNYNLSDERE